MKPFSLDRATRLCRTEIPNFSHSSREWLVFAPWTFLKTFTALIFLPLVSATASLHAAGGPVVTVEGAVEIQGPVEVQGVVETLDDVLRQPYFVQGSSSVNTVEFDIPDGKRLVIETIVFETGFAAGESTRMFLDLRDALPIPLQVQSTLFEDSVTIRMSTISMKLRLDSLPGISNEFRIRRGSVGEPDLTVTIMGYLVDL